MKLIPCPSEFIPRLRLALVMIAFSLAAFRAPAQAINPTEHTRRPSPQERMAAWQKTLVFTDETIPNTGVLTYMDSIRDYNDLAKLVLRIAVYCQGQPVEPGAEIIA